MGVIRGPSFFFAFSEDVVVLIQRYFYTEVSTVAMAL